VLDEIAYGLAMRTLGNFELGIELVELELGRANLAAHETLFQPIATCGLGIHGNCGPGKFSEHQSKKITVATKPN
jgi:hypothetical protein